MCMCVCACVCVCVYVCVCVCVCVCLCVWRSPGNLLEMCRLLEEPETKNKQKNKHPQNSATQNEDRPENGGQREVLRTVLRRTKTGS